MTSKQEPRGCLKELKRLKKHYENELHKYQDMYFSGVVDGLDMAIDILKNKGFYGDWMALLLGNEPCKYRDCIHYIEDYADFEYRAMYTCGRCKHMIHRLKQSKIKEIKKVDRFEPLE